MQNILWRVCVCAMSATNLQTERRYFIYLLLLPAMNFAFNKSHIWISKRTVNGLCTVKVSAFRKRHSPWLYRVFNVVLMHVTHTSPNHRK